MDLNPSVAPIIRFQFAMIAFNAGVVPVLNLSVFNVRRAPAFAFEQSSALTIGERFIRVDESRGSATSSRCLRILPRNRYAAFAVTTGGEIKIDSAAPAVDGPVQIRPAAIDLHVGFIQCHGQRSEGLRQYQRSRFFHFQGA
jgi:hypothetical protein